jgi:hypothetical protein
MSFDFQPVSITNQAPEPPSFLNTGDQLNSFDNTLKLAEIETDQRPVSEQAADFSLGVNDAQFQVNQVAEGNGGPRVEDLEETTSADGDFSQRFFGTAGMFYRATQDLPPDFVRKNGDVPDWKRFYGFQELEDAYAAEEDLHYRLFFVDAMAKKRTSLATPRVFLDGKSKIYTFGENFIDVTISGRIYLGPFPVTSNAYIRLLERFFEDHHVGRSTKPVHFVEDHTVYPVYLTGFSAGQPDPTFYEVPFVFKAIAVASEWEEAIGTKIPDASQIIAAIPDCSKMNSLFNEKTKAEAEKKARLQDKLAAANARTVAAYEATDLLEDKWKADNELYNPDSLTNLAGASADRFGQRAKELEEMENYTLGPYEPISDSDSASEARILRELEAQARETQIYGSDGTGGVVGANASLDAYQDAVARSTAQKADNLDAVGNTGNIGAAVLSQSATAPVNQGIFANVRENGIVGGARKAITGQPEATDPQYAPTATGTPTQDEIDAAQPKTLLGKATNFVKNGILGPVVTIGGSYANNFLKSETSRQVDKLVNKAGLNRLIPGDSGFARAVNGYIGNRVAGGLKSFAGNAISTMLFGKPKDVASAASRASLIDGPAYATLMDPEKCQNQGPTSAQPVTATTDGTAFNVKDVPAIDAATATLDIPPDMATNAQNKLAGIDTTVGLSKPLAQAPSMFDLDKDVAGVSLSAGSTGLGASLSSSNFNLDANPGDLFSKVPGADTIKAAAGAAEAKSKELKDQANGAVSGALSSFKDKLPKLPSLGGAIGAIGGATAALSGISGAVGGAVSAATNVANQVLNLSPSNVVNQAADAVTGAATGLVEGAVENATNKVFSSGG